MIHAILLWLLLFFLFFFGIDKTKRYIDALGVHSWGSS